MKKDVIEKNGKIVFFRKVATYSQSKSGAQYAFTIPTALKDLFERDKVYRVSVEKEWLNQK